MSCRGRFLATLSLIALLLLVAGCREDPDPDHGGFTKESSPELRILLFEGEGPLVVSVPDGAVIRDDNGEAIYTVPPRYDLVFRQGESGGLLVNGEWLGKRRVTIVPQSGSDEPPRLVVAGSPYRGSLLVRSTEAGSLQFINRIATEDYLRGVLPKETYVSWPADALRAQAVVSRSYALARYAEYPTAIYHLHSDISSQVYGGYFSEDPRTNAAIEETRGEVLAFDGRIITTFFHSTCGGHTAAIDDIWLEAERRPFFSGVECPWCVESPHHDWTLTVGYDEVYRALAAGGYLTAPFTGLQPKTNSRTGRVRSVVFITENGGSVEVSGNELRRLLGYSELKSTRFSFTAAGNDLIFTGEGYGHGVGLCQWGSRGMAAADYDYKEILNHYYPGAGIAQWSAIAPSSLGE